MVIKWASGLGGIQGNVLVAAAANRAAVGVLEFICVPYSDWYPIIREHINKEWEENGICSYIYQSQWLDSTSNCQYRRNEIVLNRLRLGHTRATLFSLTSKSKDPDLCAGCVMMRPNCPALYLQCPELDEVRTDVFRRRPTSIVSVLNVANNPTPILNFMKEIDIYDEIWSVRTYIIIYLPPLTCIPIYLAQSNGFCYYRV